MSLDDIIKQVFLNHPETRNNSRLLIWEVYNSLRVIDCGVLSKSSFLNSTTPSPETISRRARSIQKEFNYRPTIDRPYRRRKIRLDWEFKENVDITIWEKFK